MLQVSSKIIIDTSLEFSVHHDTLNIEQIHDNEFTKLLLGALFILSFIPFNCLEQNVLSVIKEKSNYFWPQSPTG